MIAALVASAMTVLFVLHEETDDSSAEVTESGWCGPSAYYTYYSDGTLEISGFGAIYDYNDTNAPWWNYRANITKIIIGDNITRLGKSAFMNCTSVTEIVMPITLNSVASDQNPAFAGCCNIQKIEFTCGTDGCGYNYAAYPSSDSWYQNTPWYQSRDVLKNIVFDDGVKTIGSDAFRELYITSLVIPDSVVGLSSHSFYNCKNLTELTIPISLNAVWLDSYPAFDGVTNLVTITFTPGSGYGYNYGAFEDINCWYMHTPWYQSRAVLKNIVFEDGVKHIGTDAFRDLFITYLVIPDSVESLDNHSFYHCEYLTNLTIPITLNCIYNASYPAFEQCLRITSLTLTSGTNGIGFDYTQNGGNNAFYQLTPWYQCRIILKNITFEDDITHIGSNAFRELNITSLVIPDSVRSLGEHTFYQCRYLADLTVPVTLDCVYSTESPAFDECYGITKLRFTAGTDGVGFDYTCYMPVWCTLLHRASQVTFDSGIIHLGAHALEGYTFFGTDSEYLQPVADCLSGHTFTGTDGMMYMTDNAFGEIQGLTSFDLSSVIKTDLKSWC